MAIALSELFNLLMLEYVGDAGSQTGATANAVMALYGTVGVI